MNTRVVSSKIAQNARVALLFKFCVFITCKKSDPVIHTCKAYFHIQTNIIEARPSSAQLDENCKVRHR